MSKVINSHRSNLLALLQADDAIFTNLLPKIDVVLRAFEEVAKRKSSNGERESKRRKLQQEFVVLKDQQTQGVNDLHYQHESIKKNNLNQSGSIAKTRDRPQILRMAEVIEQIGLSRSTIYKLINDGSFPKPIALGTRAVGFFQHDIDDWLNQLGETK